MYVLGTVLPYVFIVFRAFDHNGDGNISRDELRDAMIRFGHTFSAAECDEMFEVLSHYIFTSFLFSLFAPKISLSTQTVQSL